MVMKSGECWHCINPVCGCVVVVEANGEIEGQIRDAPAAVL